MGVRDVALRVRSNGSLMSAAVVALGMGVFLLTGEPVPVVAQSMSTPGKFDVGSSGAATYSIPISVPPGTAGIAPALALGFSSQGSNGIAGMGWSLSGLPSINRCPRTLAQDGVRGGVNFDANDRFCMDGQRLMVISGAYGADGAEYRNEIESFTRVISRGTAGTGPAWFEVHTKSGQIMEFGHTADSQVLAQGKPTARSWAVNKVSDTKGNYYTATYTNDATNGQAYPIEIDYTGNASAGLAPYNSVKFLYAARPDIVPTYQAGSLSKTTVRLTDVKTYAGSNLVADYRLAYDPMVTSLSSLTSVTVCAGDGSCLPPTSFAATSGGGATFNAATFNYTSWNFGSPPTANWTPLVGDFNGDGKTDFAFASQTRVNMLISNGDGTFTENAFPYPIGTISTPAFTPVVGDFDGDGKTDFAWAGRFTAIVFFSNGDGTFREASTFSYPTGWDFGFPPQARWAPIVGDFNGDAKTDFAFVSGSTIDVFLSNGDGTFSTTSYTFPGNLGSPPTNAWTPLVGDFNGDGKTDCAFAGADHVFVLLSVGDGTFAAANFFYPNSWNFGGPPNTNWTPLVGDFNGDGKTDFGFAGPTAVRVFLSKGDATFLGSEFTYGNNWNFGTPPNANWAPMVGDFNGDGRTDFAFVTGSNVGLLLSKGDGTFATSGFTFSGFLGSPPQNNWTPIVGDFNGDGKSDFGFGGPTSAFTLLNGSNPFYQLNTITNGLGATTSLTYQLLTNSSVYTKDATSRYPVVDVQPPIYVVSRADTSNGIGGTYSTTYHYAGAKADLNSRGFLGFRQVQSTDLQTSMVATSNFRQDYPYTGLTASETKALNGATLSSIINAYGYTALGGTRYQVFLTQSQASSADLDGSAAPTVTTSYQYDGFSNPTQIIVSATDGHIKSTTNTYTNDTVNWLLGRLTNASVTSSQTSQGGSLPPPPTPVVVTILDNMQNFNLWNYLTTNNMVTAGTPISVNVTIAGGVLIRSTSPSVPAFDTGALPSSSTLQITNNGTILGGGGTGGGGGSCSTPASASAGGPAVRVQIPLTFANNGSIWGGGGGGGGGSDTFFPTSGAHGFLGGGGGGGGAGFGVGGAPGSPPGVVSAQPGSAGTASAGGAGGAGGQANGYSASAGGNGGGPGLAGSNGVGFTVFGGCSPAGIGGTAGAAVVGNSFITWTATGDVRGPLN